MKKLLISFIFALLTTVAFTACEEKKNKKTLETAALDNTSWLLVRFSGQELLGHEIRLNFEDGKLNGKAVCNTYFSTYSTSGNEITVLPIGATRMMCPENSKLEIDYFNFFSKTSSYELRDNTLILKNDIGTLEFRR